MVPTAIGTRYSQLFNPSYYVYATGGFHKKYIKS